MEVVTGVHTGTERRILVSSVSSVKRVGHIEEERDSTNATNASSLSSSKQLEEIKTVYWSGSFFDQHNCCICKFQKKTCWIAVGFKGNKHWICEDCKNEWEKQREDENE